MLQYLGTSCRNFSTTTAKFPSASRNIFWKGIAIDAWNSWKWQLKNSVTTNEELNKIIPGKYELNQFPMNITPYYLSLVEKASCPIGIQAIPSSLENDHSVLIDPLKEEKLSPIPGLTHRYPDRVLLYTSSTCAMYCRHCTRKRKVSTKEPTVNIQDAKEYIQRKGIRDVILSGGDPLLLSDNRLNYILREITNISSVEIVRIGSRVPATLPFRITNSLVSVLSKYRPIYVNVHFNHPRECTREAYDAVDKLLSAGCVISNQMVLLKGVNDSISTVKKLNQLLLMMRVRPYYIFQCDKVTGTKHFHTSLEKGLEIIEGLRGWTSGLAVPHFVIDTEHGKIPLLPRYLTKSIGKIHILRNYRGKEFHYIESQS